MLIKMNMLTTFVGLNKGGVNMTCSERVLQLASEWKEKHPNATEEERKVAFDELAGQVVKELMRGEL